MNDVFGRMPIEDYVFIIRVILQEIKELQDFLVEDISIEEKDATEKQIRYYKKILNTNKQTVKRTFNCSVMSGSWVDPVPDEYYLALIDKEGCVKGVIL